MHIIPHSRPTLGSEEIKATSRVIKKGLINQGQVVEGFEKGVAEYIGVRGGVAVSSGTAGLHLSLLALDIGPGDRVIIPSYCCIALLNAVRYTGAEPILADIELDTYNIDPGWVEDYLASCKSQVSSLKSPKAVIVAHLFGQPADMGAFMDISRRYGIPIIEDCAQAIGATYRDKPVGRFGLLSVLSFYATKVMTTGEGGMVLSNSSRLLNVVRDLREYDEKRDDRLRFNYKMTDIQAAIGLSQLKGLPGFIRRRQRIARQYLKGLKGLPILLPSPLPGRRSIYYRFVIRVNKVRGFMERMEGEGIVCRRPVYRPLHYYAGDGHLPRTRGMVRGLQNTERAWREAVSIPIYPLLNDEDVERVLRSIKRTLQP